MAKQLMPPARLEAGPSDVQYTDELLAKLSLFAQLKRKPTLDKFPGTLVIRRYRPGEVVIRQGEPGWTAFYILTFEDVLELRRSQLQMAPEGPQKQLLQAKLNELAASLAGKDKEREPAREVATVYLTVARTAPARRPGLVTQLVGKLLGEPGGANGEHPESIAIDGPTDINTETMQAPMREGELFGEMSCMYGAPRSATVVVKRDCYMLEMLRNILDQIQKDAAFKARADEVYKRRVLGLHLRKLSILADLNDDQFAAITDRLDLVTCEPGQIIYDEFERSDSVYIIRSGLVKLVKKSSALINQDNIRSFPALVAALREGEQAKDTPRGKVWQLLSEDARRACRAATDPKTVPEAEQLAILQGLNDVIKNRQLSDQKEFVPILKAPSFEAKVQGIPEKKKDWTDQDYRRYHRHLLEGVFDGLVRGYRRRVGPDCVLFYCTRGEFIGEAGVIEQTLRESSCMTHGHPLDVGAKDSGRVELVRIPAAVLKEMIQASPIIHRKMERKMAERKKQTQKRLGDAAWDDSRNILVSKQFEQMGLIQGQRLMLIDLDRCTRCDECVRACVDTHDDGKSRLFLDGPRFGKYLVPTSCRSCLDPVCMIGCPVGSIHRGGNGQIVIEDWCIGCGLCSQQCPYGSIQMHDTGVIAEDARGWRYLPAAAVGDAPWTRRRFDDSRWEEGTGPFVNDWEFRSRVGAYVKKEPLPESLMSMGASMGFVMMMSSQVNQPVCFRYRFTLPKELVQKDCQLKLELISQGSAVTVWVNGQEVQPADKPKSGKREYWFPPRGPTPANGAPAARSAPSPLVAGKNVLAVKVDPETPKGKEVLRVRLDAIRKPTVADEIPEEVTQKLVTSRAVVCDLCSTSPGQVPACVNACPHDAAMRVDARSDFPMG